MWTVSFWLVCLFVVFNPLPICSQGEGNLISRFSPGAGVFGMIWSGPLSNPPMCPGSGGDGGFNWLVHNVANKLQFPLAIIYSFPSSQRILWIHYFPLDANVGQLLSLLVAFKNTKTSRHSEIKKTRPSTKQDFSGEALSKTKHRSLTFMQLVPRRAPTEWSASVYLTASRGEQGETLVWAGHGLLWQLRTSGRGPLQSGSLSRWALSRCDGHYF